MPYVVSPVVRYGLLTVDLRPLASYIRTWIRAVFFVDLTNTTRRLPCLVATTRAERMDALEAFLAEPPAERALLAPPATCWMIVVVVVVVVDVVPPPAAAAEAPAQWYVPSRAGGFVPGASGSAGFLPPQK